MIAQYRRNDRPQAIDDQARHDPGHQAEPAKNGHGGKGIPVRVLSLFRHGVFSARVQLIKPEPAIFAFAAESFGVQAAQALFIDDVAANVRAAQDAGWQALHFRSPQQCEAELAQITPYNSYLIDGQQVLSPAERLRVLQTQFVSLQGIYGPKHPDVMKLAREIAALQLDTGARADPAELARQVEALRGELAVARERYAEGHPDVVRLQRQLASTQAALAASDGAPPKAAAVLVLPTPPGPTQIQTLVM